MRRTANNDVARAGYYSRHSIRIATRACAALAVLCAVSAYTWAQTSSGMTPPGLAPGAPHGSYAVSGIEYVNLYSGNLNFNLPLLQVGGRGRAGTSVNLSFDTNRWEVATVPVNNFNNVAAEVDGFLRRNNPYFDGNNYGEFDFTLARFCVSVSIEGEEQGAPRCEIDTVPSDRGATFRMQLPAQPPNSAQTSRYLFLPIWRPDGHWDGRSVGYGPGLIRGRLSTAWEQLVYPDPNDSRHNDPQYHLWQSLYRLTFVDTNGTEHDLVDTLTGGQPINHSWAQNVDRGRVFASNDGSSLTFISDQAVSESSPYGIVIIDVTGYLFFPDGTRCRVVNGIIQWVRDSNGNVTSYTYGTDPGQPSANLVTEIRDTLGRRATITYADMSTVAYNDTTTERYDEIKFNGVGGTLNRSLKVWHTRMGGALRADQTLQTVGELFPGTTRYSSGLQARKFNPIVVSKVELPDGRSYQLKYNSYGEIARAALPTGAVIEYDYSGPSITATGIHRRLQERRVSSDGGVNWDSKQLFSQGYSAGSANSIEGWGTTTTVETHDLTRAADRVVSKQKHYFYGDPLFAELPDLFYPAWMDGREYKVETLATDGEAVFRKEETDWEQGSPVAWWTNFSNAIYQRSPVNAPASNPRVAATRVTLENGLVSRKDFKYSTNANTNPPRSDSYNLLTDTYEYDFGPDHPGQLLRRTHTDYVKTLSVNGVIYDYGCDPQTTCNQTAAAADIIHVRTLPLAVEVTDGVTSRLVSRTEFRYDEAGRLADDYGGLPSDFPGWVEPPTVARGNLTTTRAWLDALGGYQIAQAYLETHTQYDRFGNAVKSWDARGNVSEVKFAAAYQYAFPTELNTPDPDGAGPQTSLTTTSLYDFPSSVLTQTTDANGKTTTAEYNDPLDRLTKISRPDGGWTTYEYGDNIGNLYLHVKTLRELNPAQKVLESYQFFDGNGRAVRSTSRVGENTWTARAFEFDGVGRIESVINPYLTSDYAGVIPPSSPRTTTEYDSLGRAWKVTTPDGAKAYTLYDGTRTLFVDQAGRQRLSRADALGRLLEVWEIKAEDVATAAVSFPVPEDIPVPAVSRGYRTNYSYDALGNLRKVEQGTQRRYFAYDSLSRLIRVKHPEQNALAGLALTADMLNALSDNNNEWSMRYEYDEGGNLKKHTDARGISTESTYDALSRVTFRDYSDGTPDVTYAYDATNVPNSRGRMTSVSSSVSTYKYNAYDVMGRITSSSQLTDGVTYPMPDYKYDLAGHMTSQTYPSGRVVTASYDSAGRLSEVGGQKTGETNKTYASAFGYSAHGAVTEMKLGNNLWEHTIFNERLQPALIGLGTSQAIPTAQDFNRFRVDYYYGATDNNGNVRQQTISVPDASGNYVAQITQAYDYDELNRLKAASEGSITSPCRDQAGAVTACWKQTYLYDRFGNRRFNEPQTTQPAIDQYNQNAVNPVISESNNRLLGAAYRYDAAGNLDCEPSRPCHATTQAPYYEYDAENKMVKNGGGANVNSATSASYFYDGDGRRVKKVVGATTTIFVYNATGQIVAEYSNSGQPMSGGTSYLTGDNLGTPRVITDSNGVVKARHDYLPFGEEISLLSGRTQQQSYVVDHVRQKFTGYERDDETGLDYAQARYYLSAQARFTSVDPLLASGQPGRPQTWNRYAYVLNNPLRFIDPTGMCPEGEPCQPNQQAPEGTAIIIRPEEIQKYVTFSTSLSKDPEGTRVAVAEEAYNALLQQTAKTATNTLRTLEAVYALETYSIDSLQTSSGIKLSTGLDGPKGEVGSTTQVTMKSTDELMRANLLANSSLQTTTMLKLDGVQSAVAGWTGLVSLNTPTLGGGNLSSQLAEGAHQAGNTIAIETYNRAHPERGGLPRAFQPRLEVPGWWGGPRVVQPEY